MSCPSAPTTSTWYVSVTLTSQNIKNKVGRLFCSPAQKFPWGQQSLFFNPKVNYPSQDM